jgi:hypothetical protein
LADRTSVPALGIPRSCGRDRSCASNRAAAAAAGHSAGVSATVAGLDGVVTGSVTRQCEAGLAGPPLWQELIVVGITGDVDADTCPLLHMALTEALDGNPSGCCDLSGVAFFGVTAPTLFWPRTYAPPRRAASSPCAACMGMTRLVLAITGVDNMLTFTR